MNGVAELKPGVTAARAEHELDLLRRQRILAAGGKVDWLTPVQLVRPTDLLGTNLDTGLRLLGAATLLVLLIACSNVASLQLVRAERRTSELSMRAALGASRARLVRQLSVEGALLALTSGIVGIIVGYWMTRVMVAVHPQQLRQLGILEFDRPVLWFGFALSAVTCTLCGILPAWYATGVGFSSLLRGAAGRSRGPARTRFQSSVIVGELALSIVLLAGAGLP